MNVRHEVLIGPYRSGKSWYLLEKAYEHCCSQNNLAHETLIIVPSQRYRALIEKRLQKLLLQNKEENVTPARTGLWGLKILTFNQFCQASLLKAGVFMKLLPEAARSVLTAGLGRQLVAEGKIDKLAPVINFSGTQASILSLIDEWQANGYRAAQVLRQVREKETSGHHIELAEIYSLYDQTLQKNNYIDEHGLMFKLIDFLNSNSEIGWLNDFIVVDGFDRWHILQLKLLKALSKHVAEIYVAFDYEHPGDNLLEEYAWKEKSYEQIRELLGGVFRFTGSINLAPTTGPGHPGSEILDPTANLSHSESGLNKSRPDANPADPESGLNKSRPYINLAPARVLPGIGVFCGGDRLAEAAIIAARVKAAIVLDGVSPDEIVVTTRNLKIYRSTFEAAFQDAGLDYFLDGSIELMALPMVRFLLALLSLTENDFGRRQIIDCLRSHYFRLSAFNLTADNVEQLNEQSLVEKIKVVAGGEQWQAATRGDIKLAASLKNIFDTLTPPDNINSAIQYATWVEDLLDKVVNYSAISDYLVNALNKFRSCLATLIIQEEALRTCGIETIEPGCPSPDVGARFIEPAKRSTFYYQRLIELVKKANFQPILPGGDKVLITGAPLVSNERYKRIYVAGMLEGEFPVATTGSGFLTPEELAQWQRFGIPIYNPRLEPGFEYALFASLINRAQEKIIFSYPAADIVSSKEEPVPSFFLTGLNLINENNPPELLSFETFSKTANSARNALAYCLWHKLPLEHLDKKHQLLLDFVHKLQEKLSFADKRCQQLLQSPLAGYLADHVAAGTVKINLPEYWSASGLNEYGKCPFSYWLTRVFQFKPHEEPQAGLSAMEKGSFYHKVLELFYAEVITRKLSMAAETDKELRTLFEQAIADAIIWLEKESWFRPSEFWEQEKEDLAFHLRNFFTYERNRFLKEAGQFAPYMVEADFGPQSAAVPLVVNKDGRSIKLRGKIDRIDIEVGTGGQSSNPKKLRLVDYKSGSTLPSDSDFESGRNIQLPLYALAAEQAVLPGSYVEGCSYLSVRAGKDRTQEDSVLRTYLNVLPDKIFQFVERIEAGDFSLNPSNPNICKSCDHQKVCRVREFPKQLEPNQEEESMADD